MKARKGGGIHLGKRRLIAPFQYLKKTCKMRPFLARPVMTGQEVMVSKLKRQ